MLFSYGLNSPFRIKKNGSSDKRADLDTVKLYSPLPTGKRQNEFFDFRKKKDSEVFRCPRRPIFPLETGEKNKLVAIAINTVDPGALDVGKFLPNRGDVNVNGTGREVFPGSPDELDKIAPFNDIRTRLIKASQNLPLQRSEFDMIAIIR